ncbi:MAG: cation transporter [Bdellovibrionaceae bacterium]|nr:cation transporter [Pseudobdellovibrionaceae bacterium]
MTKNKHEQNLNDTNKLSFAILINVVLTVVQFVAGLLSGSLSLVADALHNFSDAGSIVIALVARKMSNLPRNPTMTYGFKRAEIIGTLINSTTLALVGFYLLYEVYSRIGTSSDIQGWTVIWVASIAFIIDVGTALLTYSGSKSSLNIKAAFIHNISDAMSSLAVILSGVLILLFEIYWVDLICSALISVYVIYHAFMLLRECILILMQAAPSDVPIQKIQKSIESIKGVMNAEHIHLWQLNEKTHVLEVHVETLSREIPYIEKIKNEVREIATSFGVEHTTIQIDFLNADPMRNSEETQDE